MRACPTCGALRSGAFPVLAEAPPAAFGTFEDRTGERLGRILTDRLPPPALPLGATHRCVVEQVILLEDGQRPVAVAARAEELCVLATTDAGRAVVQGFRADGTRTGTLADLPLGGGVDQIAGPVSIAFGPQGQLVLLDGLGCRVVVLGADGRPAVAFGGPGNAETELRDPTDFALTPVGTIIADTRNNRVVHWDATGRPLLTIGLPIDDEEGEVPSGEGPGEFCEPAGVAITAGGLLLVADTKNHRVQIMDPSGAPLRSFGGSGEAGGLQFPSAIRVSSSGDVFVLDQGGRRVQKFDLAGLLAWSVVIDAPGVQGDAGSASSLAAGPRDTVYVAVPTDGTVLQIARGEA